MRDSEFLRRFEIEIQWNVTGWLAYRFGILIAHSWGSKSRLINYLKEYFS